MSNFPCFKYPSCLRAVQAITGRVLLRFLELCRLRDHIDQEELCLAGGPLGTRSLDESVQICKGGDVVSAGCQRTRRLQQLNLLVCRRRNDDWALKSDLHAKVVLEYLGCSMSQNRGSAVSEAHDNEHDFDLFSGTQRRAQPWRRWCQRCLERLSSL